MIKPIDWEDVLKDGTLVGRDIEVQEDSEIFRGPIKGVSVKGNDVVFDLLWSADHDLATEKWTAAKKETAAIFDQSATTITSTDDGLLLLIMEKPKTTLFFARIFPQDSEKLDPEEVDGLDLASLPGPEVVDADVDD